MRNAFPNSYTVATIDKTLDDFEEDVVSPPYVENKASGQAKLSAKQHVNPLKSLTIKRIKQVKVKHAFYLSLLSAQLNLTLNIESIPTVSFIT